METFALPVIPFAVVASLCLVFTFLVFFLREHARPSSALRTSLLPLNEETPRMAGAAAPAAGRLEPAPPAPAPAAPDKHDHAPGAPCGCRNGERPPCAGCLKRSAAHA